MQYVGKVGGYVYNQWNSINPATLSGAIDIIVIEHADGSLHCSPFHIRFGKFQIIKPLQKKIDFYVNNIKTDLPMKLGDGGEGFFVFETTNDNFLSQSALTSPVISPTSSTENSPSLSPESPALDLNNNMIDDLDLNDDLEQKIKLTDSKPEVPILSSSPSKSPTLSLQSKIAFARAKQVTQKLNIPSKIDINGDMVLDMDGYKPNSQKNIDSSDERIKKIFIEELLKLGNENENLNFETPDQDNIQSQVSLWDQIIKMDENGSIRISNVNESIDDMTVDEHNSFTNSLNSEQQDLTTKSTFSSGDAKFFKTLRLTSEQLKQMKLNYGENKLMFKLNQSNAQVFSNLYLWKAGDPIVISDIDGTITKSDALGHVLNLIGRDWTHVGVAKLFSDIHNNGYHIIYLTARSVGQAESTRTYLRTIVQDNYTLPSGPVILSPDRTMAALKREVILKKPEVFKMSCLNDIKSLYFPSTKDDDSSKDRTPFYAGFGNRITDAISYRSVNIPSHRIFTINPDGEVHLELLELSGIKSSYLAIGELVDQYFPPVSQLGDYSIFNNDNQVTYATKRTEERFSDVNYWRDPINFSDLSDIEEADVVERPRSSSLLSMASFGGEDKKKKNRESQERPKSISSFASPLKGFFNKLSDDSFNDSNSKLDLNKQQIDDDYDEDYEDTYDEDEDDDYDDDDQEDYEDEDDEDQDDYEEDEDEDYDEDLDEEDDYDEDLDEITDVSIPNSESKKKSGDEEINPKSISSDNYEPKFLKASSVNT